MILYMFFSFCVMFGIGHYYVNVRGNSYENIFGIMLLVGLGGAFLTGMAGIVYAIYRLF